MQIIIKTEMKCHFPHPIILENYLVLPFPVCRMGRGIELSWTAWLGAQLAEPLKRVAFSPLLPLTN